MPRELLNLKLSDIEESIVQDKTIASMRIFLSPSRNEEFFNLLQSAAREVAAIDCLQGDVASLRHSLLDSQPYRVTYLTQERTLTIERLSTLRTPSEKT